MPQTKHIRAKTSIKLLDCLITLCWIGLADDHFRQVFAVLREVFQQLVLGYPHEIFAIDIHLICCNHLRFKEKPLKQNRNKLKYINLLP